MPTVSAERGPELPLTLRVRLWLAEHSPRRDGGIRRLEWTPGRIAFAVIVTLYVVEMVRTAWFSDDAAITMRSVLNFVNGYGPTFNIDERVDAFTDPLWFLLLSLLALTRLNVFWLALGFSVVCSVTVFVVLWRFVARSVTGAALALGVLLLSKAWIDFSTSGLENPLSNLTMVVAAALALRVLGPLSGARAITAFGFVLGLAYLVRPDAVLPLLPMAAVVAWRFRRGWVRGLRIIILGAIAPLLWTVFSLFYYGSPVPNTAYAKLVNGIGHGALIRQGLKYLLDSLGRDPITLVAIFGFSVIAVVAGSAASRAMAAGAMLYLLYVVWIGGDFMSGRFLTIPLALSATAMASSVERIRQVVAAAVVLAVLGAIGLPETLLSGRTFADQSIGLNGISDERGFYFATQGAIAPSTTGYVYPAWQPSPTRPTEVACGGLGWASVLSGPSERWIDACALADPLLARLKPIPVTDWRIGHFARPIPAGYIASVRENRNLLANPTLHRYYSVIRLVTRGPLFSGDRLWAIIRLNTGQIPAPNFVPQTTAPIGTIVP